MKTFSTSTRNAFYSENFIAIDLVEIHLKTLAGANNTQYYCSGGFPATWDSPTAPESGMNTYTAQGDFIGFDAVGEDFDVRVGKFGISLSALGANMVQNYIDVEEQNRLDIEGSRVVIFKAFLDPNNALQIIDAPVMLFDGIIFNVSVSESQNSSNIKLDCATLFADFERTAGRKTNNGSNWLYQGVQYDTSMEKSGYVGATEIKWGKS
jgi:hypothetical protein